jgi:hypothetical protein
MTRRLLTLTIAALALHSTALAGPFHAPAIPEKEVRYYRSYYAREEDKPNLSIFGFKQLHGETSLSYSEWARWEGEGSGRTLKIFRHAITFNNVETRNEFTLGASDELVMVDFHRKWFASDGVLVRELYFDYTDPSLAYPENTFHHMILHWLARSMDLKQNSVAKFYVWLDTTFVYPMVFSVEGEERIKVKAGEFDCWRVTASVDKSRLDSIVSAIIGRAMPQYIYWLEKGGTHGLVRLMWPTLTGFLRGGERYQTQDLIKVTR